MVGRPRIILRSSRSLHCLGESVRSESEVRERLAALNESKENGGPGHYFRAAQIEVLRWVLGSEPPDTQESEAK